MKILMLNAEYNGVAYWRMFEPARWLNMVYPDVSVTYFHNEAYLYKPLSQWEKLAKSHDLIVFGRVSTTESLATYCTVREWNQRPVVVEMDDDWTCVEPQNISYKFWREGSPCWSVAHNQCQRSDMFQFSTLPLKRSITGKYGNHDASWISPNLIDIDVMQAAKETTKKIDKEPGKIRIGWAGSATHYGDFLTFLPAMKIIADKYPQVEFLMRGMKADYFVETQGGVSRKGDLWKISKPCPIDPSRIKVIDGTDFWVWPKSLAEMDLDIVIVPLDDNKFNKAKSNCRFLEFSSVNVPGVYADVYPYAETITEGFDGFLARNTEQWVEKLSRLIESEELRRHIADNAFNTVVEKWSLQNNIGIWKKNYEEMLYFAETSKFQSFLPEGGLCQTQ